MGLIKKFKDYFLEEDYEEYEEEYEEEYGEVEEAHPPAKGNAKANVVSLQSVQKSSKVILIEPRAYAEAQEIADHLKNRRAVIVNLQRIQHEQAKRIVDFLSGTVYAIGGDIQQVGTKIFLCTPENVDVSGSISIDSEDDRTIKRW
ncbi:cell division protein SepF [Saccharococcus caldoxylosilyticus]|uniref:cell division protein SepF n=1 Tax=Saccharococcus caldoxylosilyticus TaxID=81408 RepID=UPI001FCC4AE5|nr:cell division protein SepF [Parageobacillus caldoxylosilyticus]BDG35063.1 cell division protein SepF [Parageobacillus caldoxylosilyticus]BDG38838.1 cell division protein SepF [Parageobacillus caldoxylosilyticus]BDG42638.1 cell division protein SepF [Parageobacillus caldoxylosilyticus]